MTTLQNFAFYVIPVLIGGGGWLYAQIFKKQMSAKRHHAR